MTGTLACFVVRLAGTGANRAKFEPLRAAIGVKRQLGLAPDTAGIQQIGGLYFLFSPAKQIIYGRLEKPIPMVNIWDAFWMEGQLDIEDISNETAASAYTMNVTRLELY